jgi:serine/threonine-protein phosphatase 2A activator
MSYIAAHKCIKTPQDMLAWQNSSTHMDLCNFILSICDAIPLKKVSDDFPKSKASHALVAMLHKLSAWLEEFPPLQQQMRYGNKAFCQWHEKLKEEVEGLLLEVLPEQQGQPHPAIIELAPYLIDSFGNATRIDYGSGHECTFVAFLLCLQKLDVLTPDDMTAVGLFIFVEYMQLMRQIQQLYFLEPAGSHGVWGLDDYHFLPYLFGASQLKGQHEINPADVHDRQLQAALSREYLYLDAIQFIYKVKHGGPFQEHSPILFSISQIPLHQGWPKVCEGFKKMYLAEVLGKLPVIQHFLFGSLLPATWEE